MGQVVEAFDLVHRQGAGPDQAHFAAKHIEKLGEFVNAEFTQPPADGGDARVVGHLEHGPGHFVHRFYFLFELLGVGHHGAELVDGKRLSVEAGTLLPEQDRAGIVHQRYSTNTFPMWRLAQPFRVLAHNGEINTLRGNISRMRAREPLFASERFGADLEKIKPVIVEGGSDSAMLDNAAELLLMGGRSLPHAMMMLVPEAWGARFLMSEDKRAFYEYHAAVMEPWDGPAALVFTDGSCIGATLDRNGLRPARYTVTRDGLVVLASETGVLDIARRPHPQPRAASAGENVPRGPRRNIASSPTTRSRRRSRGSARTGTGSRSSGSSCAGCWRPRRCRRRSPEILRRKQRVFGYTEEDLKMVIAPMAARGQEAVGSMGNDAALAVLFEPPATALRVLQAALRPGDQPAD